MRVRIGAPIEVDGMTVGDRDRLLEQTRAAVEALRAAPPAIAGDTET
jgi:hypothetical protein